MRRIRNEAYSFVQEPALTKVLEYYQELGEPLTDAEMEEARAGLKVLPGEDILKSLLSLFGSDPEFGHFVEGKLRLRPRSELHKPGGRVDRKVREDTGEVIRHAVLNRVLKHYQAVGEPLTDVEAESVSVRLNELGRDEIMQALEASNGEWLGFVRGDLGISTNRIQTASCLRPGMTSRLPP